MKKTGQISIFPPSVNENDIVYTPNFAAKRIIEFYRPQGFCLDPCLGDGAFYNNLPRGSDWCEIDKGRDFFEYRERPDWIIGNPPYSIFREWLFHSFSLSDNIVYLIPVVKPYQSYSMLKAIYDYGGIVNVLVMGTGRSLGFEFGFAVGAVYFKRGYIGATNIIFDPIQAD